MRWLTMLWWQRDTAAGECHAEEREQQLLEIQRRQLQAIQRLEEEIKFYRAQSQPDTEAVKFYRAQSQPDAQGPPRADC